MDDFSLTRLIARQWLLISLITILVGVGAWWVYQKKQALSYGSMSVTVQAEPNQLSSAPVVIQNGGNSDVQLLISTTQSWLKDPAYVKQIMTNSGVALSDDSLAGLSQTFVVTAGVVNSSVYQVQFSAKNNDQVSQVMAAVRQTMTELQNSYNRNPQTSLKVQLLYSDPVIASVGGGFPLAPVAGLAVGFILAIVIVALLERKRI